MFFQWSSNKYFPNGFVNKFANWFLDVQNSTLISLLFISSRIKWYRVSICLLLLWKTWFLDSAIAELLSQKIEVDSFFSCCNLERVLLIHTVWHAAVVAATYYASAEDSVTMDCFLDAHTTDPDPKLNRYPDVFFQSSIEPAKSLLVYPINLKFELDVYWIPKFVVPAIYLKILFPACEWVFFGVSIKLEIKLTANIIYINSCCS